MFSIGFRSGDLDGIFNMLALCYSGMAHCPFNMSSAALAIMLFWHGSLSITNSQFILLCRDFIHASINARGDRLGKERSTDSVIGLCKYDNSMIRQSYEIMNSPAPWNIF